MITCPWCGTSYLSFQSNCSNCGGSLPLPAATPVEAPEDHILVPPPAPREVPRNYTWRLLFTDGWGITGFVFALLGVIFTALGIGLTLAIITAFVGIPFAGLGIFFLIGGAALLVWRYREAQMVVQILREGSPVLGSIERVQQNFHVQINGRYPWTIVYRFQVNAQDYRGKVTTLSQPDLSQRPGKGVYVLYQDDNPEHSTIYPHPYGYYDT